jgi:hypothetical protein
VGLESIARGDTELGESEEEAADGRIANGGYFAKNRNNRGGRLLAREI